MMSLKRLRRSAAGYRVHHLRYELDKTRGMEKLPDLAENSTPDQKCPARFRICDQVEVTLAISNLDIGHSMPFIGQRPQCLRQQLERFSAHGRFAGLSDKRVTDNPDKGSDVNQPEQLGLFRRQLFEV